GMKAVFDGRTAVVALAQAPYWCAGGVIVSNRTVPEVLDSSLAVAYKIVRGYIHPRRRVASQKTRRVASRCLSIGRVVKNSRGRTQASCKALPGTDGLELAISRLLKPTRVF